MRRVLLLLSACFVTSMVFASVAVAQQVSPEEFSPGGPFCPDDEFFATAPGDPGEGTGTCFETAEAAATFSNTGEVPSELVPDLPPEAPDPRFVLDPETLELQSFEVPTAQTGNVCPEPFTSTFEPGNPETAETFTCLAPQDVAAAEQPEEAPVAEAPVADDTAELPTTGGPALLLPLAGLMVATGLGLAFIRRG